MDQGYQSVFDDQEGGGEEGDGRGERQREIRQADRQRGEEEEEEVKHKKKPNKKIRTPNPPLATPSLNTLSHIRPEFDD